MAEMSEEDILKFWQEDRTFEKSLKKTEKGKPYIFYDGPPFATGLPHYGHILVSVIKDVFPRFWTMKGRYVKRVWGWDCHGLPIENIAEKELGINSKDEIEKMGVRKFNDFCRSKVLTYAEEWKKYINRIGRWVDFEGGYKTMDLNYMESVWWAFKQLYEKGYLYEGEKILLYCPRCATPLAKSEIAMDNSYKNVKDISVVVKFKLKNTKDIFALSWTTTPWTLPSNLALAVNPSLEYVFAKDKSDGNTYILAKGLLNKFYKSEVEYEIIKTLRGKELEGIEYEPVYPYFKDTPNAFKFVLADFVTDDDGTGIVHTAPAFGEDDNLVCRNYEIPIVQPVDENGKFTFEVADYKGKYVHNANEEIVRDLKMQNKIILSKKIEHEYPFCYRCDTKLIYRALPAWFVNIQKIKEKLLEINSEINWTPDFLKDGRMKYNIETAPDWNITRNRYWASAIPVWKSKSGKIKVIGSLEELKKYSKEPLKKNDLHKDYLDKIILKINGEEYKRIPEVIDCWFESGSMSFAQFHYPFENKKYFEENFPAQFITEYIAQTRAWFYYMMVLSSILFNKRPFENVLVTGTILSENGQKMSKSKNNYPDPLKVIEKYGADALRFYLLSSSVMNAENTNFSEKGLEEVYKKIMLLMYNVANFYRGYFDERHKKFTKSDDLMDKWILSRTEELRNAVEKSLEEYNTIRACSEIKRFIEDLSTWYVRNSRERFNKNDLDAGRTLYYVLEKTAKTIAPILPFVSEKIYKILKKEISVHLEDYPKKEGVLLNKEITEKMALLRNQVSNALSQRDRAQIGTRWPLSSAKISDNDYSDDYIEIFKREVNVKKVEIVNSDDKSYSEIDAELTPELEAEGFARELTRKIQAGRKKENLVKSDVIEVEIFSDIDDILKNCEEFIKERVGAEKISFGKTKKKFDYSEDGEIKGKKFSFGFSRTKINKS